MGKDLIIVESPTKVKTIRKFLGPDYMVEASVGHVRDLPSKSLGVDEEHGFAPQYQVIADKEQIVGKLRSAAKAADTVYLAPDPDREGEAIAWHIAELLKDCGKPLRRITFNEITKTGVDKALKEPRDLDVNLFYAQQARRILDRLAGYKISPLLWKTVKRGISAGRVQSVALRLIVDREMLREAFVPQEYWLFRALFGQMEQQLRLDLVSIDGRHTGTPAAVSPSGEVDADAEEAAPKKEQERHDAVITSQAAAEELEKRVLGHPFHIDAVRRERGERKPQPPFITSTLQQSANRRFGYSAKRTMSIAQRLYEGLEMADGSMRALITYMRTDSTRVAEEAQEAAEAYISRRLGEDFLPPSRRIYKSRKSAQDAHEAIRPVDVNVDPESIRESLSQEQYTLYKLIWSRFVASQMASAVFNNTTITASCQGTIWQARGQQTVFAGWQAVYPSGEKDSELPDVGEGQEIAPDSIEKEQKFTRPPARYSEASLVHTLEVREIGRPSTYASIISTLVDREYVVLQEKHLVPTELGRVVCDQLMKHFDLLMKVKFTAEMERDLDEIEEGQQSWNGLIADFADKLNPLLKEAEKTMESKKGGIPTELQCPECGKPLLIRFGKAGEFLACSGYPTCRYTSDFTRDEAGHPVAVKREEAVLVPVGTCPECGNDLVVKKARTGSRFVACTGYPDCHYAVPLSTGVTCPDCGEGELVEKSSRKGKVFYSCSRYPACTFACWNRPFPETCPDCGSPYLLEKKTRAGLTVVCPNPECHFTREGLAGEGEDALRPMLHVASVEEPVPAAEQPAAESKPEPVAEKPAPKKAGRRKKSETAEISADTAAAPVKKAGRKKKAEDASAAPAAKPRRSAAKKTGASAKKQAPAAAAPDDVPWE